MKTKKINQLSRKEENRKKRKKSKKHGNKKHKIGEISSTPTNSNDTISIKFLKHITIPYIIYGQIYM